MKTLFYFGSFCLVAMACPQTDAGGKNVVYSGNPNAIIASSKVNAQITGLRQGEKEAQAAADKQRELISQQKSLRAKETGLKDYSTQGYGSAKAVGGYDGGNASVYAAVGGSVNQPLTVGEWFGEPGEHHLLKENRPVAEPGSAPVRTNTKAKTTKKK